MQTSTVSECRSRKTRNEKKNTLQLQSKCYRCKLEKLNSDILHICNINNKCLVGNQGMPSIISTWLHGTFENLSHIHMKNVLMKFWLVFSHAKHSRSVGTHFHLHSWATSSDPEESIGNWYIQSAGARVQIRAALYVLFSRLLTQYRLQHGNPYQANSVNTHSVACKEFLSQLLELK